ncbi:MAG: molybdenum cofactor guanylyltransferase [Verrucomicrobiota bacterium]
MSTIPFAAALIAGGRSRRMGCDKARLPVGDGVELWRRQLSVLRELGAEELLISCRPDQLHFAEEPGVRLVFDEWPDAGPLGGIVPCLESVSADRLMVLGVDMPLMTAEVLRHLLSQSGPGRGAVFRNGRFFEPLAALYLKSMAADGQDRLRTGNLSLQPWLREGVDCGILGTVDLPKALTVHFQNLNSPQDL